MGAAPTREAESIVYRRKSFKKKNSSPATEEPRGSAVGGTTNDSIAPARDHARIVYNAYGTGPFLSATYRQLSRCIRRIRSTDREKRRGDPILWFVLSTAIETPSSSQRMS